jgi:hypothetical protein
VAAVAQAPANDASASSAPAARRLRVGVVADAAMQPRWLVEALAKVAASDFAELAFVDVRTSLGAGREGFAPRNLYTRLDERLFGRGNWSQPADVRLLVPGSRERACDQLVDVIVALGDVADDSLLACARHGVWRYWVRPGRELTGSGLLVRTADGAERLVHPSWSRTFDFSAARTRDSVFAKSAEFLTRSLRALYRGELEFAPGTNAPEFVPGTNPISAVVRRAITRATAVEQWGLAFRFVDIEPWTGSLEGFHRLRPPHDGFWADPFPVQRDGRNYIFFEELPGPRERGHISVIEVDRQGRASQPTVVLERDYHLSYPFLVEDGGELYMIPESYGNGTIEIYRCVEFPGKWRRERVLLDGLLAVDATVHHDDGRWWMFANVAADGAEVNDELHVFTSDKLLGDWKPLAKNPVKSDVRGSRPAGKLFTQGGRLYRPSQVCAPIYGAGIALQRVTRLDENYEEQEERRILPAPGERVLGLHTINRCGDLSVTDAFMRRSRLRPSE